MTAQLDYAPANPLIRRRRRRIILFLLFLCAIYPAWRYGPPVTRQLKLLHLQRQCLNYTAAPDHLVFDDDPADLDKVAALPDYRVLVNRDFASARFPRIAGHTPRCWADLTTTALPTLARVRQSAIIFCHERISRDGIRRLVIIEHGTDPAHYPYNYLNLDVLLVEPAALTGNPVNRTPIHPNIHFTGAIALQTRPLRIYAGQVDPADPARFTIRYRVGEFEHFLEGRLNDGGGDVTIKYLGKSLTSRATEP